MEKLSCVILTKNEEKNIKSCLESIKWADEILIVDDYSEDKTLEICRKYTDRIFRHRLIGFPHQRSFALKRTLHRWVLMLDADERVSPELKDEIQDILRKNKDYSGFYFKRLNIFLGRPIYHCGWYEATNLRLFDKEKAHYELDFKYIDEVKVEGRLGVIEHPIIHYTAKNLRQYLKK